MSAAPRFDAVAVGDVLPALAKPPITRLQLALFAGASGDHNPIHVDDEAARAGGLPGVIAHGMLNMAFLAQSITRWVPQRQLRSLSARFVAIAYPGDAITCTGRVASKSEAERTVELELAVLNHKGETLQSGRAVVALD